MHTRVIHSCVCTNKCTCMNVAASTAGSDGYLCTLHRYLCVPACMCVSGYPHARTLAHPALCSPGAHWGAHQPPSHPVPQEEQLFPWDIPREGLGNSFVLSASSGRTAPARTAARTDGSDACNGSPRWDGGSGPGARPASGCPRAPEPRRAQRCDGLGQRGGRGVRATLSTLLPQSVSKRTGGEGCAAGA